MIVRILKGSKSFSSVAYNEERIKNGEGYLLCTKNFGATGNILFSNASDYRKFLIDWSNRNARIKSPQFHVTISCKDRAYTPDELQEIGEKWLQEMGYGKNPYMIYFHSNTKNNHIHIITSRVDEQGKKINDSYEKEKAVRILDKIIGMDRQSSLRDEISKALKYSFNTEKQFYLILESRGYKILDNGDNIKVLSGGSSVEVNKELIRFCMSRYKHEITKQEKDRLYALINKYSQVLTKDEFIDFMKSKFGLSFIYFGEKDKPYGYCIIDNSNKKVYKGGDVCSIKRMLSNFGHVENVDIEVEILLKDFFVHNKYADSRQLNHMLGKYRMKYIDGKIINKYTKDVKLEMPDDFSKFIKYNDRLNYVRNVYNPQTKGEYEYLSKRFVINSDDLKNIGHDVISNDNTYYKKMIEEILSLGGNLKDELGNLGIDIRKVGDEFIFIDNDNNAVYSNESLDLEYTMLEESLSSDIQIRFHSDENTLDSNEDIMNIINSISDMIYINTSMNGGDNPKKRKRR